MGGWFLATAFSNFLAGLIASLTGVGHGDEGGAGALPPPQDTVGIYGSVFGIIGVLACISGLVLFALAYWLTKWMHREAETNGDAPASSH